MLLHTGGRKLTVYDLNGVPMGATRTLSVEESENFFTVTYRLNAGITASAVRIPKSTGSYEHRGLSTGDFHKVHKSICYKV